MSWFTQAITSSIGRKLIMSLTGLFLVSFLIVHVSGNLQLFKNDDGEAFNIYTKFMTTNPVIKTLEWGLLIGFVLHIVTAYLINARNRAARPVPYAHNRKHPRVSWFSKTMIWSGTVVLVFLVVHLVNFYGAYHYTEMPTKTYESGETYKDMFSIVAEAFKNPAISILYIVSMALLGGHLIHGFQSAFRTLGIDHKKYTPLIVGLGYIIGIVIPLLFASMPFYFWFIY